MNEYMQTDNYAVGYGKPPKNSQFKKGVSGNPSGRRKKPSDLASGLLRELDSKVIINENGRRTSIKKSEGLIKQLVTKALSGNLQALRLLITLLLQFQERAAEQQQNSPKPRDYASLTVRDLTDEELDELIAKALKGLPLSETDN
jgi:hypothetical protein